MNETELERLVVRLVGDGSSYQQMMQMAAASSEATSKVVAASAKSIESFKGHLEGFAKTAVGLFAGFGLTASLTGAMDKFEQLERGQIRLKAAVAANGEDVEKATARYAEFGAEIARATTASKGQVLAMVQTAAKFGLTGQAAEDAVQQAIALAQGNMEEAGSFVRATAMMAQGHTEMVKRQLGLRGVKSETELLDKINKRLTGGWEAATKMAQTTGGGMEKLKRSLGSITMEIGKLVSEAIGPAVEWLNRFFAAFNKLNPAVKSTVALVAGLLIAIPLLGPMVASAFGTFATLLAPLVSLPGAIAAATAAVIYFTGTGGAALDWFGQQWQRLKDYIGPTIQGIKDALAASNLSLAFEIALAQIKIVFAKFSRDMQEAALAFEYNFTVTMEGIVDKLAFAANRTTMAFAKAKADFQRWFDVISDKERDALKEAAENQARDAEKGLEILHKKALEALKAATDKEIAGLGGNVADLIRKQRELIAQAKDEAAKVPPIKEFKLPTIPKIPAQKVALKLEATEFGSAEALAKVTAFREMLAVKTVEHGHDGPDANTPILADIRDTLKSRPLTHIAEADFEVA